MSLTIVDRRTTVNEADSTTGWTNAGFGTTTTDFAEGTAAVAAAVNNSSQDIWYVLAASTDLTNTLVYIWLFNNALQNSWTTGATSMFLSDGTNDIAFHIAGGDRFAFRHLEGPVNWNSCVLDMATASGKDANGETTEVIGTFAAFDETNVGFMGGYFITQSKALGGGYNCAIDIMRYGNDGIYIIDGTAGSKGNFFELASGDRSTADGAGHGVFRELQPIAFGCQAPLTFGHASSGVDCYFEDQGVSVVYENWDIADDKYYFAVEGNATGTNYFSLSNSTIASAGPNIRGDFNSGNIDTLTFDSVVFSEWGNSITFSNSADATGHNVTNCSFITCGQIDPGDVNFSDNVIDSTANTALGALLLDSDGTANWANLDFISGGSGHAIYITDSGTYDFDTFTYTGYGTGETTDAVVYNNSGGAVTINVLGGDTPSVRNGASATTTVNNNITVTVGGVTEGTAVKIIANETSGTVTKGDTLSEGLANSAGQYSYNQNYEAAFGAGLDVIIRCRNQGFPTAAIAEDGGAFTDETTAANSTTADDMTLLPASPASGDAYYFGHNENFYQFRLDISQPGTGTWDVIWEYYNGTSWALASGISDGTNDLKNSGEVSWTDPGDWADTTINSQGPYKYIRGKVDSFTSISSQPLGRSCKMDVTRYLPFSQNRIITSDGLNVVATWVEDTISTF